MIHVITEPCVGCKDAACVTVCPADAIHPRQDERDYHNSTQLFIDPDSCIGCTLCVDECPVTAIYDEDDVPPQWRHFIKLNADHFQKPS
jgi:formate hydrogenlyase subunit 6/NADH:ubiquinone oxidoreductase subunit I